MIEDGEFDNQDQNMQEDFDQPRPSTPEAREPISDRPASVAQNVGELTERNESIDATRPLSEREGASNKSSSKEISDKKHELAVKRAESKESRRKKLSRTSSTSNSKASSKTKKRSAETMKGKESTSGSSKPSNDNANTAPVEPQNFTPVHKDLNTTQQLDRPEDRSLSPELLVNVTTIMPSNTSATNPPVTDSLNTIKSSGDVAKSKLPKKKRKLGTRKTEAQVTMPASDVS